MPLFTSLARGAVFAAVLAPAPLWADVTADDVWQNIQDYLGALGGDVTADVSRSNGTVAIDKMVFDFELPLGVGTISINLGSMTLSPTDDGAVNIKVPDSGTHHVSFSGGNRKSFEMPFDYALTGFNTIASGDPGDVTYAYTGKKAEITLDSFVSPDASGIVDARFTHGGVRGATRVIIGDSVKIESGFDVVNMIVDMTDRLTDENGVPAVTKTTTTYETFTAKSNASLPGSGMSILNLAQALRDGLSVKSTSRIDGYGVVQSVTTDGKPVMSANSSAATYGIDLSLDQDGFKMSGPSENIELTMELATPAPMTLGGKLASIYANLEVPVLKSVSPAPVDMTMELRGFTLDDAVWAMFDPGQALPRDPADMVFEISGEAVNNVEWLDFMNVEKRLKSLPGLPIEIQNASFKNILIKAVGAELSGAGAMTFDNTDLTTFEGMPRPEGEMTFEIKGANGLIDTLVSAGFLPKSNANTARMGLALAAKPVVGADADTLQSHIEINAEGHVLVNGARMK